MYDWPYARPHPQQPQAAPGFTQQRRDRPVQAHRSGHYTANSPRLGLHRKSPSRRNRLTTSKRLPSPVVSGVKVVAIRPIVERRAHPAPRRCRITVRTVSRACPAQLHINQDNAWYAVHHGYRLLGETLLDSRRTKTTTLTLLTLTGCPV